jgi:hypothetical protein
MEELYKSAIIATLKGLCRNRGINGVFEFTLHHKPCWERYITENIPCAVNQNDCCNSSYEVTYDYYLDTYRAIDQDDIVNDVWLCNGSPNCNPVCELEAVLEIPLNQYFKRGVLEDKITDITESVSVSPNPAYDYTDLTVTCEANGKMELFVNDSKGKVVYNQAITKEGDNLNIRLDASEWAAGAYYYNIIKDGKYVAFGGFVVMK